MFKLNNYLKTAIVTGLVTVIAMGFSIPSFADSANVVTLGANLSEQQKQQALTHFGVKKDEVHILEINNKEERKYLEGVISDAQIGNITISCSYVELLPKGSGLQIETTNLNYVTEGMIRNALITSGITDAKISAYAPFSVSGTGALTGILKGFSNTEIEISEEQKEVANEEMIITGQLGEIVGNDVAIGIVNDIKAEVIENKPKNNVQIGNIINNVTNNYNVELTAEQKEELTQLMRKIDKLDLDFEALKDSLTSIGNKIKRLFRYYRRNWWYSRVL